MEHRILNTTDLKLETFMDLSISCIYAFRCDRSMKVYVSHTSNLLIAIGRISSAIDTSEYAALKHDMPDVVIDILCTDASILEDNRLKKLHTSNYANEYKQKGYALYRPTNLVQYKIDRGIKVWKLKAFYVVDLINSRNDRILVGAFKSKREMDSFCKQYYPNDTITGFYYANNHWTNEWRSLYSNDLIEERAIANTSSKE